MLLTNVNIPTCRANAVKLLETQGDALPAFVRCWVSGSVIVWVALISVCNVHRCVYDIFTEKTK